MFFWSAVLDDAVFGDKPFVFQAGQRAVDLGRFNVPVLLATDHGLEGVMQFVAVAGTVGQ